MKTFKCVGRYKNGNRITGYKLVDEAGNVREVNSGSLKNAIKAGEAVILNLTLSTDGRLIPKTESVVNNNKSNNSETGKVISFSASREQLKGGALLKILFNSIEDSEVNGRIVEFGTEVDNRKSEAYFFFETKDHEDLEFCLIKREDRQGYLIKTPLNEYIADDLKSAQGQLADDIEEVCMSHTDDLRKSPDTVIDDYHSSLRLAKEFKLEPVQNKHIISVAGNNICYIGPKDTSCEIISIPDFVTVISNNAFDNCSNLKEVYCEGVYQYSQVKEIINSKKIKIIRGKKNT